MIRDEPLPLRVDLGWHRATGVRGFTWAVWSAYDAIRSLSAKVNSFGHCSTSPPLGQCLRYSGEKHK